MSEDVLYRDIGKFFLGFQSMESMLTDICLFVLDPNRDRRIRLVIEQLPLRRLLDVTCALVLETIDDWQVSDAEAFRARLKTTRQKCERVIARRNALVHSDYDYVVDRSSNTLVDVIRTNVRLSGATSKYDSETLDNDQIQSDLAALGDCLFEVGLIRTQLFHWFPGDS